jgi:hypothetical protein
MYDTLIYSLHPRILDILGFKKAQKILDVLALGL